MVKINVIPLLLLLGLNHGQSSLHMSKIFVHVNTKEKCINQFANWLYN